MLKNREFGGATERKPKEQDSYHGCIYDSMRVRGLIVLVCLILLPLAPSSNYGYSHNGAESRNQTDSTKNSDSPLAARSTGEGSCSLSDETITCSNIPNNTGEFVANYTNENSNNWTAGTQYVLYIENCKFTGDTLSTGWLPVSKMKIIISKLHIKTSVPITIEENAFSDNNFQNITYLTLSGSIARLNKKCFAGLHHLETLEIDGSSIQSVAQGILNDVQGLTSLQITPGINDTHLNGFLWNTTLHSLTTLDIRDNNLKKLKSEIFRGLTNMLSLYAERSHITSIESTILESSANTIQLVTLSNNELESLPVDIFNIQSSRENFAVYLKENKLKTLPQGIFDKAINSSKTVEVFLGNNNWHCDCDLAWLQNYIGKGNITVDEMAKCASPEINKNKSFIEADFSDCNNTTLPTVSTTNTTEAITLSTTENVTSETTTPSTMENTADSATSTTKTTTESSPTTTEITTANTITSLTELSTDTTASSTVDTDDTTTSSTEEEYIDVTCNCITCNTKHMRISTETNNEASSLRINGITDFIIKEDDELIQIYFTIWVQNKHVLIWMTRSHTNDIGCNYKYFNAGKEPPYLTANFSSDPNTAYMICVSSITSENEITISVLNCRAYTTLPSPPYRSWLLIKETSTILLIFCFALLVSVIVGIATVYYVLLRNPKLIKGSERVTVVNHRTGQVIMIMPKGYSENNKRHSSQTSYNTASTGEVSYETANEPKPAEESTCMFGQMCDKLRDDYKTKNVTVVPP